MEPTEAVTPEPWRVDGRLAARALARAALAGGPTLGLVLLLGPRAVAAALVLGGLAAATAVIQRVAVERAARRGLPPASAAAFATAGSALLVLVGASQAAWILASDGVGLAAQAATADALFARSRAELAALGLVLVAAALALGGVVGGLALVEHGTNVRGRPGVWLDHDRAARAWIAGYTGAAATLVALAAPVGSNRLSGDTIVGGAFAALGVGVAAVATAVVVVSAEGTAYGLLSAVLPPRWLRRGRD